MAYYVSIEDHLDMYKKLETQKNYSYRINLPTIYRENCSVLSTGSLKTLSSSKTFSNGVPKILHYVSKEEDLSKIYSKLYTSCTKINNDMHVVLWTDASFDVAFSKHFDKDFVRKWKETFPKLDVGVRTTIIRTMVLSIFGGVSLSLDTTCEVPISDGMTSHNCYVNEGNTMKASIEFDRENDYGESVFGCIANHPFLRTVMDNGMKLPLDRLYFTKYVEYYNLVNSNRIVGHLDLHIARQMLPMNEMQRICNGSIPGVKRKEACQLLKSFKSPEKYPVSVMVHQPIYGLSNFEIDAKDFCTIGVPVLIVIT